MLVIGLAEKLSLGLYELALALLVHWKTEFITWETFMEGTLPRIPGNVNE